jgi:hypothetical protein
MRIYQQLCSLQQAQALLLSRLQKRFYSSATDAYSQHVSRTPAKLTVLLPAARAHQAAVQHYTHSFVFPLLLVLPAACQACLLLCVALTISRWRALRRRSAAKQPHRSAARQPQRGARLALRKAARTTQKMWLTLTLSRGQPVLLWPHECVVRLLATHGVCLVMLLLALSA